MKVRGLQGAGDSLVAGFCLAFHEHHLKGEKRAETPAVQKAGDPTFMRSLLRSAQAAAAGSLTKPGTAVCERTDFDKYLPTIQVEKAGEFFDVRREDGNLTGEVKLRESCPPGRRLARNRSYMGGGPHAGGKMPPPDPETQPGQRQFPRLLRHFLRRSSRCRR